MTAYPYTKISASGVETESTAIVEVTMFGTQTAA